MIYRGDQNINVEDHKQVGSKTAETLNRKINAKDRGSRALGGKLVRKHRIVICDK